MRGGIEADGRLWIERAGKKVRQQCPFAPRPAIGPGFMHCGDWCPHFGDPAKTWGVLAEPTHEGIKNEWKLNLCHITTWLFEKFTDERPQAKQEAKP